MARTGQSHSDVIVFFFNVCLNKKDSTTLSLKQSYFVAQIGLMFTS